MAGLKLHIGGTEVKAGWIILDIQPGPHVDIVGSCTDLSALGDGSVDEIYASHVVEHLGHRDELKPALAEFHRVLAPGGYVAISVPDIVILSQLMSRDDLDVQQRYEIMLMMFGGQYDAFDFHKVGFFEELLALFLLNAGFKEPRRVEAFDLFEDYSRQRFLEIPISLNMVAVK
jgi:predicted SAM-dependent methyltransferase